MHSSARSTTNNRNPFGGHSPTPHAHQRKRKKLTEHPEQPERPRLTIKIPSSALPPDLRFQAPEEPPKKARREVNSEKQTESHNRRNEMKKMERDLEKKKQLERMEFLGQEYRKMEEALKEEKNKNEEKQKRIKVLERDRKILRKRLEKETEEKHAIEDNLSEQRDRTRLQTKEILRMRKEREELQAKLRLQEQEETDSQNMIAEQFKFMDHLAEVNKGLEEEKEKSEQKIEKLIQLVEGMKDKVVLQHQKLELLEHYAQEIQRDENTIGDDQRKEDRDEMWAALELMQQPDELKRRQDRLKNWKLGSTQSEQKGEKELEPKEVDNEKEPEDERTDDNVDEEGEQLGEEELHAYFQAFAEDGEEEHNYGYMLGEDELNEMSPIPRDTPREPEDGDMLEDDVDYDRIWDATERPDEDNEYDPDGGLCIEDIEGPGNEPEDYEKEDGELTDSDDDS